MFVIALGVVVVVVLGHNEILNLDWLSIKDSSERLFESLIESYGDRMKIFLQNTPFIIGLIIGGLLGLRNG